MTGERIADNNIAEAANNNALTGDRTESSGSTVMERAGAALFEASGLAGMGVERNVQELNNIAKGMRTITAALAGLEIGGAITDGGPSLKNGPAPEVRNHADRYKGTTVWHEMKQ